MNTRRPGNHLSLAEQHKNDFEDWHLDAPTVDSTGEVEDYLNFAYGDMYPGDKIRYMAEKSGAEGMKQARDLMKERADEIVSLMGPGASIAVVDEFSTASEHTMNEVRRAFKDADLHVYEVFSEDFSRSGVNVRWNFKNSEGNPDMGGALKLSYSGTDAVGVKKDRSVHTKYSDVIRNTGDSELPSRKRQLREEMSAIGEKVAAQMAQEVERKIAE